MGFVSDIVSRDSNKTGYAELSDSDLRREGFNTSVRFVDITSQDDLVSAKEALHEESILFLDIAYVESNGMSLESVYSELQDTVDSIDGDLVHKKNNDVLIATPRDVQIRREKL